LQQHHGDKTGEKSTKPAASATIPHQEILNDNTGPSPPSSLNCVNSNATNNSIHHDVGTLGKSPGEIAFFKLLHTEFKKASHFFDRATEEFTIREERVREGMEIMTRPNAIMVHEKWSLMAKSIYRLYKDLLLLETFAIMTYCSFSKILKKHDKVTGYDTKNAFMANIVNKANFTHYPKLLAMVGRCERLYEEVSLNLLREGKEALYEDERECSPLLDSCCGRNVTSSRNGVEVSHDVWLSFHRLNRTKNRALHQHDSQAERASSG
jgi:SPX domain